MLKLVDVIGSRARNWPIRDGKDQARLIASSSAIGSQNNGTTRPDARNGLPNQNENSTVNKPASSKHIMGDPHASLSLFTPQETSRETSHHPPAVAPRVSAKPPPRDYHDLFAGNETDSLPAESTRESSSQKENKGLKAQTAKPPPRDYHDLFVGNESDASPVAKSKQLSPQKENKPTTTSIATKGGSGKNFQPSRLFETDHAQAGTPGTPGDSPDKFIKPNPQKYNHFELGGGHDDAGTARAIPARPKTKHQSQWGFEDFMTPEKVPQKIRDQDVRHFGWSDDEPNMESPGKHPAVHQPRPDARPHFEFQDDGTPAGDRRPAGYPRGQGGIKGMGLYKNDLFDAAERSPERKTHPLATVTNVQDRRKVYDPHFHLGESPADTGANGGSKPVPESRTKAVQMMDAQWEATDDSPGPPAAHQPLHRHDPSRPTSRDQENYGGGGYGHVGVKTGGDGMGGKKGAGRRWGFGDESDEDGEGGVNGGKFQAIKKQQAPVDHTVWDF